MNGLVEARIAGIARARGCSFYEAAALAGAAGARRRVKVRQARQREAGRAEAVRRAWWWRADFEL
jgi:hypothetical protein